MSCERCGGFKVFDYFDGPFHCSGYRCINCGAITDMRIAMATQTRTVVPPRRTKPVRRHVTCCAPCRGCSSGSN